MHPQYQDILNLAQELECAYVILGNGLVASTLVESLRNLNPCAENIIHISRGWIDEWLPIKNPTYLAMEFTDKLRYALEGACHELRNKGYKKIVIVNGIAATNTATNAPFQDAWLANMVVPGVISRVVHQQRFYRTGMRIVHISSACLYADSRRDDGGFNEWNEDNDLDPDNKFNPYYYTKLGGELMYNPETRHQTILLRPRLIYGNSVHKSNLINKVRNYACVVDCPQSMTNVDTLCAAAIHLARLNKHGRFNIVDDGHIVLSEYFTDIPAKPCTENFKVIHATTNKLKNTGFPIFEGNAIFKNCVDGLCK